MQDTIRILGGLAISFDLFIHAVYFLLSCFHVESYFFFEPHECISSVLSFINQGFWEILTKHRFCELGILSGKRLCSLFSGVLGFIALFLFFSHF